MNIKQLKEAIDLALERGIDPNCTVVLDASDNPHAWEWAILESVTDPTEPRDDLEGFIWFTLTPGKEADGRFTPGHWDLL